MQTALGMLLFGIMCISYDRNQLFAIGKQTKLSKQSLPLDIETNICDLELNKTRGKRHNKPHKASENLINLGIQNYIRTDKKRSNKTVKFKLGHDNDRIKM